MSFATRATIAPQQFEFHCLSYKNQRAAEMRARFEALQIPLTVHPGVEHEQRVFSIMYGHLAMIKNFLEGSAEIGIFCENDIIIHKEFPATLPGIEDRIRSLDLDVLLVGYLCENPIDTYCNFPLLAEPTETFPYKILGYPDGTWGAQMYALSRRGAEAILAKYGSIENPTACETPFAADWTITKEGNRALLYPLLVIEGSLRESGDYGHNRSHDACKAFSYKEGLFI